MPTTKNLTAPYAFTEENYKDVVEMSVELCLKAKNLEELGQAISEATGRGIETEFLVRHGYQHYKELDRRLRPGYSHNTCPRKEVRGVRFRLRDLPETVRLSFPFTDKKLKDAWDCLEHRGAYAKTL